MLNAMRLDADQAVLLVIDLQEKLLPLIAGSGRLLESAIRLVRAARIFDVPVLATEQYPQGIGATVVELGVELNRVTAEVLTKTSFSCCGDDGIRERLRAIDRAQVIVAGIETHVCVQQTALDLLSMEHQVFVCADAVGSRTALDHTTGLERMRQAGAWITTVESALFELCERCGTTRFKAMLELIKQGMTTGRDHGAHGDE